MNAPDSAAGKRAKCPKCQEVMILPGGAADFEVVEEPAPKPKSKPRVVVEDEDDERPRKRNRRDAEDEEDEEPAPKRKPSRRVVADEDEEDERPSRKSRHRDEDDEDDDRPRKKGKGNSKKKVGPPMALIIGGGVALLLLLAGGLYFAFSGGSSSGGAAKGGNPAAAPKGINWVAFDAPDGSFTAAFPDGAPNPVTLEELAKQSSRANANPQELVQAREQMKAAGLSIDGWTREERGKKFTLIVMSFPSLPPQAAAMINPEAVAQRNAQNGATTLVDTSFSSGGLKGKQILTRNAASDKWTFGRIGMAGQGHLVMIAVESDKELKADDADAKAFFEKFQWKK